ncbi:MAG: guanylate kinase, partial [Planctomycetota bacterium]
VPGGMQVAEKMPESVRIFVLPPNMESLRARLEGRRTEAAEQLAKRLAEADGEIAIARDSGCYSHFVVNDVLETTVEQVKRIIEQERRQA